MELRKIDFNSKDIIHKFIQSKIELDVKFGLYHYSINSFYSQITNTGKHFYSIVKNDNDETIYFVNFTQGNYYRLIGSPISISNNIDNENNVFEHLFDNDYIKQAYIQDFLITRINKNKYNICEISDYDFYIDGKLDLQLFTNKYKHDNKINVMLKCKNFEFRPLNISDKFQIMELFNEWKLYHSELHSKNLFKNYFTNFNQILLLNQLLQFVLLYSNKIIALSSFIPTLNHYCQGIIQFAYKKESFENCERELRIILSQVGQIMNYLCLINLKEKNGIRFMSCAGTNGENIGLLQHKQQTCSNVINYYKITKK